MRREFRPVPGQPQKREEWVLGGVHDLDDLRDERRRLQDIVDLDRQLLDDFVVMFAQAQAQGRKWPETIAARIEQLDDELGRVGPDGRDNDGGGR